MIMKYEPATRLWRIAAAVGLVAGVLSALPLIAASPVVNQTVAIVDPYTPSLQAGVTAGGALKVTGVAGSSTFGIDQTTPGTTNGVVATGNVASGATDSGNPLKVGGVYNSTLPTYGTGQRGNVQIGTRGSLSVQIMAPDGNFPASVINGNTDGDTATNVGVGAYSMNRVFNGTTWDRLRGTTNGVHAVPAAGTTAGASFLNIAAGQATTTVKSGAGTLYAIVLNSAATATNTTTIYDNTAGSGTVIGRPAVTTATVPTTLTFGTAGIAFATGLTVVTAAANGGDMTVVYK